MRYGTWLASAIIACGMLLVMLHWPSAAPSATRVIMAGIGLFILLPVSRVILMLAVFLHQREYVFGAIAATVLAILCLGVLLGLYLPSHL